MQDKIIHQWSRVTRYLDLKVVRRIQVVRLRWNVKHLSGSIPAPLANDQLIVLCLVKNGELYIKSFIEHYQALGVDHIVFLDNGSDDRTIQLIEEYSHVTVLSTNLPFRRYKLAMRTYLIERFGRNCWSLYVDIDELFDYPGSGLISLQSFLLYLNNKSYTAVVAHMLDMFSEEPILEIESDENDPLKDHYRYYDISNLTRMNYFFRNQLDADIQIYFGGIRRTIFGTDYEHGLILSKHPLIFLKDSIIPIYPHEHGVRNAHVADITCVLLHYKFIGGFLSRTMRNAREENYHLNSIEYKRYLKALEVYPDLKLMQPTSVYLNGTQDLVRNGFLTISDDYTKWVERRTNSSE
jgi:glycosyltransferase involved in cell wall biosynthesis